MKIIYLLLDAISYDHSWLSDKNFMPYLSEYSKTSINFHNHYAVTHNTRGNLAAMLYGASSSITKVMGRKQSFRDSGLTSLQMELRKNNYKSAYIGTQPLFQGEKKNDDLDFSECLYLSPSMSDFYIPAENFNKFLETKLKTLDNKSLTFLHYTDCHEPYETPENILTKKDYPLTHKFHYRPANLIYRIPRKIFQKYLSLKNIINKKKIYKNYPYLSKLCENPFGSISTPERYSWYYEKVWSNENFFEEYKKMMTTTLTYIDKKIKKILKYLEFYFPKDTIIFVSSDHGNNGILSPKYKNKHGLLSSASTHVPLTLITFDEKIREKINLRKDIYNYTSHTNFYKTILNLINPEKYKYNNTLLNEKLDNNFVISEVNDARFEFGECILRNNNKIINLRIPKSDDPDTLMLISKKNLLNNISDEDYELYRNFKLKYNLSFN